MSVTVNLSVLLAKWAFADTTVLDEDSLEAAKNVLQSDPENILANIFVSLAFLQKGLYVSAKGPSMKCRDHWTAINVKGNTLKDETFKDGDSLIDLSTLSLFAAVLYGAATGFLGCPVTDMLTSTQEAVKRATGAADRYRSAYDEIKKGSIIPVNNAWTVA